MNTIFLRGESVTLRHSSTISVVLKRKTVLMRIFSGLCFLLLCFSSISISVSAQQISAPEPQRGSVYGTITDTDGGAIPDAVVVVEGATPNDRREATADNDGFFRLTSLPSAVPFHIAVTAKGFANFTSPDITLTPGQALEMSSLKLTIATVETSVNAVFSEEIALQQVKAEEQQRVFGVIPNFYTVYDQRFVPLTTGLKYKLAFKASTDVVSFGAAIFIAAIDQAADTPNYVQGAKGYGQRVGAAYADATTDIFIGGAILPSLLHQDPRYFYQGTGTKKSRALHAISSPFICKGDDGRKEFNYSSIGGDLAAGALTNIYYPPSNRGPGIVFDSALISTGGRMINALAQEFILNRYTTKAKTPQP